MKQSKNKGRRTETSVSFRPIILFLLFLALSVWIIPAQVARADAKNPDVTDTTTVSGYTIQKWTTVGTGTWTIPVGVTSVDYFVVAGGGSGGGPGYYSGGGGAGGMRTTTGFAVTPGATVTVTVGDGGTAVGENAAGNDGGSSAFSTISTVGGGGGGGFDAKNGRTGGSGGGGNGPEGAAGAGTINEGNNGGAGAGGAGGGGGGNGSVGVSSSENVGGNGGAGTASSITGTSLTYAAGGGGAGWSTRGTGTAGVSGQGGLFGGTDATDGSANRGGGGGGSMSGGSSSGAGGSGIVIIKYATPKHPDVFDFSAFPGNTILKWTTVGTGVWEIPAGVTSVEYLVVAGGGAGGSDAYGGGGGAAGLKTATGLATTPGASVTVTVGAGGTGVAGAAGNSGGSSVFDTISTTGGGGGARIGNGVAGGSGGGAGTSDDTSRNGGAATGTEGSAGGGANYYGGGGGGGQAGVGTSRAWNTSGNGGIGYDASGFGIVNTQVFEGSFSTGTGLNTYTILWRGQSFTPVHSHKITSVKLYLARSGADIGTVTVAIKATSGGLPTGADLCSGTYNGNNLGTSGAWIEFTLGSGADLTAGTKYAMSIDARNSGGGCWLIIYGSGNSYLGGTQVYSGNSGATWSTDDSDVGFQEISTSSPFVAGGGGGSTGTGTYAPGLGRAGGGNGGISGTTGTAAAANSGSGGGGYGAGATGTGLAGGSGIVVIKYATPTAVTLKSFGAKDYNGAVLLEWKTGYEVNNLGFHIYREGNGQLYRLTPEPVAGSALLAGSGTALTAGRSYHWWDFPAMSTPSPTLPPRGGGIGWGGLSPIRYWLEDIDLNGTRTMHGPVAITQTAISDRPSALMQKNPELLSEIGMRLQEKYLHYWKVQELKEKIRDKSSAISHQHPLSYPPPSRGRDRVGGTQSYGLAKPSQEDRNKQRSLANSSAIKILVNEEGWYRVSQAELVAAGLSARVKAHDLQLYVEGQEQPIRVSGKKDGRFGPGDAIEFYGVGLDTPITDTQVYWLVEGNRPGKRIPEYKAHGGQSSFSNFLYTVERKDRLIYFAAVKNGDEGNFVGPVVSPYGVDQILSLPYLDPVASGNARLEVSLQGVTEKSHRVRVLVNDEEVGEVSFQGQSKGGLQVEFAQDPLLHGGENLVSLVAQAGEDDISAIDYIRLSYWRTYTADEDVLKFTAQGGRNQSVSGFSRSNIRVFDITDPHELTEVEGKSEVEVNVKVQVQVKVQIESKDKTYAVTFRVPGKGERTMLALTGDKVKSPKGLANNKPSHWAQSYRGYDMVMISHKNFLESLRVLKSLRESQGLKVALIDIEDLYDEFNFGVKSPKAIKDFLALARSNWKKPLRYVLLVGDASFDPRNYYGYGEVDYLPTKLIDTRYQETASDDWFVDFDNNGLPEMAIGRLPVNTVEEANTVVAKIISYERYGAMREALLVADRVDKEGDFDFELASEEVAGLLPHSLSVRKIYRADFGSDEQARVQLLSAIGLGPLLVNFMGHGSVEVWRGDLLDADAADGLVNSGLPFFMSMTCLNGFFQDPYGDSLAEALLKANSGGALAVWTSSGMTVPGEQAMMNKELVRLLFNGQSLTIGEAAMGAKSATTDQDVRRTWILFGDPTTKLKY